MTSGFFNPAGPVAAAESHLVVTMVALMLIVVVPMFIALYTIAWKYRAGNKRTKKDYEPERSSRSPWSQIVLWMIPAALVAVLGTLTWQSAHALDPFAPIPASEAAPGAQPLTIQVVALPWKWLFIYPAQNIATVNVVEFPAGTPVHFELTADAPMSSFWIPQLGSQIYAMAAMTTQLNLIASSTGEYTGRDTEINGEGYAGMTFAAWAVSPGGFDDWVESIQQATGTWPTLTQDSYNALAAPSENNPSEYFSSVAPGMFEGVVMKDMVPEATQAETSSMQNMQGMKM